MKLKHIYLKYKFTSYEIKVVEYDFKEEGDIITYFKPHKPNNFYFVDKCDLDEVYDSGQMYTLSDDLKPLKLKLILSKIESEQFQVEQAKKRIKNLKEMINNETKI